MTKIKVVNAVTTEEFFERLMNISPYRLVAIRYFRLKGIKHPNIADLLEAYHELAKMCGCVSSKKVKADLPRLTITKKPPELEKQCTERVPLSAEEMARYET